MTKTIPKNVIRSKKDAIETWVRFMIEFRKQNPTRGTHRYRVSFKNFLASFDITFAPRMGKIMIFRHLMTDMMHMQACLSQELTKSIGDMILANNDLKLYVW
ncbi:MAG: hypothetical protein ACYDAJ_11980 [Nitrosotalea sp.]